MRHGWLAGRLVGKSVGYLTEGGYKERTGLVWGGRTLQITNVSVLAQWVALARRTTSDLLGLSPKPRLKLSVLAAVMARS